MNQMISMLLGRNSRRNSRRINQSRKALQRRCLFESLEDRFLLAHTPLSLVQYDNNWSEGSSTSYSYSETSQLVAGNDGESTMITTNSVARDNRYSSTLYIHEVLAGHDERFESFSFNSNSQRSFYSSDDSTTLDFDPTGTLVRREFDNRYVSIDSDSQSSSDNIVQVEGALHVEDAYSSDSYYTDYTSTFNVVEEDDTTTTTWSHDAYESTTAYDDLFLFNEDVDGNTDTLEVTTFDSDYIGHYGNSTLVDFEDDGVACELYSWEHTTFYGTYDSLVESQLENGVVVFDTFVSSDTHNEDITGGESLYCVEQTTLVISSNALVPTDTVVENQENVLMFSFDAYADGEDDLLLTSATFTAIIGTTLDAGNFTLSVDTNGDLEPDVILEDGVNDVNDTFTFNDIVGGGFVIPAGETVRFWAGGDFVSSFSETQFQVIASAFEGERLDDCGNVDITVYQEDGDGTLFTLIENGQLLVNSDQPVQEHLLLAGSVTDSMLYVELEALDEDIDVTDIRLDVVGGDGLSIDRILVVNADTGDVIGHATTAGCQGEAGDFCLNTEAQQLVVLESEAVDLGFQIVLKSDNEGAVSGELIQLELIEVEARGYVSSNDLGDDVIFTDPIISPTHTVVFAKIEKIGNANPDADGTAPPTGISTIGEFAYAAAPHVNSNNGDDDVILDNEPYIVTTTDMLFDPTGFAFYNKADQTITSTNYTLSRLDGTPIPMDQPFMGSFKIVFTGLETSAVDTEIDEGTRSTFSILANVLNSDVGNELSTLQVSLLTDDDDRDYTVRDGVFAQFGLDDFDLSDTVIRSTGYIGS